MREDFYDILHPEHWQVRAARTGADRVPEPPDPEIARLRKRLALLRRMMRRRAV